MKKNLMKFAAVAFAALGLNLTAGAAVTGGDIYSADLVERGGSVIPSEDSPLTIGQRVIVRLRLLNRGYDGEHPEQATPWRFMPVSTLSPDPTKALFAPQLGLMFGGQQVWATFIEQETVTVEEGGMPIAACTDLFFEYTVKSGDLTLPARFMSTKGVAIGSEEDSSDYAIRYCNYGGGDWKLTDGGGVVDAITHFSSRTESPFYPQLPDPNRPITGVGLGIYVKTIDFDTIYFEEPDPLAGTPGIWRRFYCNDPTHTALPTVPTVKVDGKADAAATMYVWVDDDTVAAPLTSDNPEWVKDPKDPTKGRWVIRVPVPKDATSATFRLQGKSVGETVVRMSSSKVLSYNEAGDLIPDWVERPIAVVDPPDPYVMLETLNPAGEAQTSFKVSSDYKKFVGQIRITLSQPPAAPVKVVLTPDDPSVIPEELEDRLMGLSLSYDETTMPWEDRDLEVPFAIGETTKTLYIYGLDPFDQRGGKVTFTPSVTGEGAAAYTGEPVASAVFLEKLDPVIKIPAEKEVLDPATLREDYTLFLTVDSTYRSLRSAGWKVEYKSSACGDSASHDATNVEVMDEDAGEISADLAFSTIGANQKLQIRVKDPNGYTSGWRTLYLDVTEGKSINVTLDKDEYAEDDRATAKVTFSLSQPAGDPLYLFLEPINDDARPEQKRVSTPQLAKTGNNGIEIKAGHTEATGTALVSLLDGGYGDSYRAEFKVIACQTRSYSATKIIRDWEGGCVITVTNVEPRVTEVWVGGAKVQGGVVKDPIVMGIDKTFKITSSEPSKTDREGTGNDRFETRWKFGTEDWIYVDGDPGTAELTRKFTTPGEYTVEVQCRDKDMRKLSESLWSESTTFTMTVLDKPQIVITPVLETTQYYEDQVGNAYRFNVTLTAAPKFNDIDTHLRVELVKTCLGDSSKYSTDDLGLSKDVVEFASGKTDGQSFNLAKLDGTAESGTAGFRVVARVIGDAADDEGKRWTSGEIELYILNREPSILRPTQQVDPKDEKPIETVTTIGSENKLSWGIKDVEADKRAMTVEWMTSEGNRVTYHQGTGVDTETDKYMDDVMSGTHTFKFTSAGSKTITMTVTDKDGDSASRTFYYIIEASKSMTMVPHGPAGGYGTANSKRYRTAAGLGEGRVYATNLSTLDSFKSLYNCGVAGTWDVYAYGYKVGDIDDGVNLHNVDGTLGYYTNRDTPIDGNGNPLSKGATGYAYVAKPDKNGELADSFLYTWLQISYNSDGGGAGGHSSLTDEILGKAVQPEYTEVRDTGVTVVLPGQSDSNAKTYTETILEAVFSREYLATDNMGDINQDGIPDIYVDKYGLGVSDSKNGQLTGDDLLKITSENHGNDDEDFLPTTGIGGYSALIPGLPGSWQALGTPFTAKTEIRGYGEGLNDAPFKPWVGITGVKPERRYTDPRTDPRSTLDGLSDGEPVEFYAWLDFAAAHGIDDPTNEANKASWELWSPECPSDPMLADTDDDGFTDGYEYFFWYRAHVGYMDGGVHRYLTGRAYDPRNPGEGRFISSAEIEALMNPGVAYPGEDAKTRDTDNDGLPDLLEFEIGTNPFDFDSDGDGLPDGFEIMLGGTSPLVAASVTGVCDAMRNYDGDAMAFTTPLNEVSGFVIPQPLTPLELYSYAVIDPNGDTDGIQWYVSKTEHAVKVKETVAGRRFEVGRKSYFTTEAGPLTNAFGRLARALPRETTWAVTDITNLTNSVSCLVELAEEDPTRVVRLMPTRLAAGELLADGAAEGEAVVMALAGTPKGDNKAWVYGRRDISLATEGSEFSHFEGFGMLTVGRYGTPAVNAPLAALPRLDGDVALIHSLVYQEFGFDPRTAWNATTPLAPRWGSTKDRSTGFDASGEQQKENELMLNNYNNNVGVSTRTRDFTLYDEFLLLSFFLNNGVLGTADVTPTQAMPWRKIWSLYTTNGQGPDEPTWDVDIDGQYKGRTAESDSGDNGADTDMDGVPDGWELYVMAGPKNLAGQYVFAEPYSAMGPFKDYAGSAQYTDNDAFGQDADGLTELQEFAGTDSCAYYSLPWNGNEKPFSTTIVRPDEHKNWINKFMPTDPWNADTDGDGLGDDESGTFSYGTPLDDGSSHCVAGGGGNPLSVDTDMDGLPDPWEAQFAGQTPYAGADAEYQKDADGNVGNPKQGLCDGMDGSVWDAYNSPRILTSASSNSVEELIVIRDGTAQVVDRDYDHDGLENWQEYMTGAMRVWRYDDPNTTWDYIPFDYYFSEFGTWQPNYEALAELAGVPSIDSDDDLLYLTLFDTSSPIYNPHFITDATPCSQYFSRVKNGWDLVYSDEGSYYMLPDNLNGVEYGKLWGYQGNVSKYICTSPIKADTDQDGMDDYYELFHGMNPLLGEAGILEKTHHPCDIVYDAWYQKPESPIGHALSNVWRESDDPYDFVAYPWLNGLAAADPDGDDIRNQNEAIMPLVAPSTVWYHTDPTPLWMTDSSFDMSLVRRFFRMPVCFEIVSLNGRESILHDGQEISLKDCDGFGYLMGAPVIFPFNPDYYDVSDPAYMNWAYSFEENEGYDSDHDAIPDYEELQGKFRGRTDPQDADSPRRRQAMYFQGPSRPSALQSMPFSAERHPRQATSYPDDMSFLQYTVECWVRPESTADATVIERASWTSPSHLADEQNLRCNFRIAIRNGKWYTMFDSNGTLAYQQVEVEGSRAVRPGEWTYVAATYDTRKLTLYVNGEIDNYTVSSVSPEYGSSAVVLYPGDTHMAISNGWAQSGIVDDSAGSPLHYWFDREYYLHAFLIGASFKNDVDLGGPHNSQLNVLNARGWSRYKNFFTGYVDEIRVWDGAQDADTIGANYLNRRRYTREDALENRSAFYKQWVRGERRYEKDISGNDCNPIPELRFHWAFDSIPGAENEGSVVVAPHGFLDGRKAPWSSPAGYEIPWWSTVVGGYGSVYAGDLNWVTWIPNTVTHLPRFDGSTVDSAYWNEDCAGITKGSFMFARTAEPVSLWTQYGRNGTESSAEFYTTDRRFWQMHVTGTNTTSTLPAQFAFTGRHLNLCGDDLLPLGGAFVKYVDAMWDDMGASATWEQTGVDADNDGLPDWWQEYADQNYRDGLDPFAEITWNTPIAYEIGGVVSRIPANEAYKRDLAKGMYVDAGGQVHPTSEEREAGIDRTQYEQTAKSDGMIPDWWKTLRKIDNEPPFDDSDNDGLNNYVEYVASELMPFRLQLDPLNPKTQDGVIDYFRRPFDGASKLYLGEMLTDHDQMEDHWERSLGDPNVADAAVWDALKDADEDGWNNFAENRYNGYSMSTLAQLVSHAVGDFEALDAPVPSIKLRVRYNGDHKLSSGSAAAADGGDSSAAAASSGAQPALVVRAFSKSARTGDYVISPDAVWTMLPGQKVDKEVYLGGWEDRTVRGTMAPGNVNIGGVKLMFAQVPQSDLYSWTDETGIHISEPYSAFKAALEKNPDIIQNVQDFTWNEFVPPANEYTSSDKAVTVTRDALTQKGYIAVYGERVGTIDLTTGDFEFDMGAMVRLTGVIGTYDTSPAGAWGFKEAIFKLTYSANVPSLQQAVSDMSLALPDSGFVRSGLNSFEAFYDLDGNGAWNPGEPFGVLNDVDVGWASRRIEIELSDMSAVTPRVKLWDDAIEGASDRAVRVGAATFLVESNRFEVTKAPAPQSRVRVVRYKVDNFPVYKVGVDAGVVLEKDFAQESRDFLHEGDFLADGDFDIDWKNLYTDVVDWWGAQMAACEVTNVTYLVVYNWDASSYRTDDDTNTQVKANATLVTRRFERTRSVPTASKVTSVYNQSRPTFSWRIDNEDKWASWFGTTYTAFKLRVRDLDKNLVYDSGIRRLPAKDTTGVYSWTAPLYVGETVPETGVVFKNLTEYTWEVAVYNAKFKTDTLMAMETQGNPFSKPETFRMNVTSIDASSEKLAVRVCYAGPAQSLLDKIRVQAFESPDFTGDPVAEATLRYVDAKDSLSPLGTDANVEVFGLPKGRYFLRAYIDTNGNGVHDDWESWGYLNERDRASKKGIFNPVPLATALEPALSGVRKLFIEDCDTDGDWFPDVWEAEQNGNVFDRAKIAPVTGDAELIGANPQLSKTLNMSEFPMLEALFSRSGLALLSGVPPTKVRVIENSDGTLGIQVENKVETVKVTSMDFDADGNIEIKVAAATAPVGMDADMAKLFNAKLVTQKTVTCTVYRRASLAAKDGWEKAGSKVITIGNDKATSIKVSGGKAGQGFYKVVIEE